MAGTLEKRLRSHVHTLGGGKLVMKTLRTVLVAILLPVAFPAAAVPTSEYYLTPSGLAGSEELNMLTVISGSTFSQFPQNNPLVAQTPIAVNGVIRTAGSRVDEQPGSTYSLSGTFLGHLEWSRLDL